MKELHQLVNCKWWTVWSIYNSLPIPTPQHLPDVPTPYHTIIVVRHPLLSSCKVGRNTSLFVWKTYFETNYANPRMVCTSYDYATSFARRCHRPRIKIERGRCRLLRRLELDSGQRDDADLPWIWIGSEDSRLSWCHCHDVIVNGGIV